MHKFAAGSYLMSAHTSLDMAVKWSQANGMTPEERATLIGIRDKLQALRVAIKQRVTQSSPGPPSVVARPREATLGNPPTAEQENRTSITKERSFPSTDPTR